MLFDKNFLVYRRYLRLKAKRILTDDFIKTRAIPLISDATVIDMNTHGHPNIEYTLLTHSEYYILTFILIRLLQYFKKIKK